MTLAAQHSESAATRTPDCYLRNLAALYRSDPALAVQIDATPFHQIGGLEAARDGNPTLRLTADDGRDIYVHSRYRPLEEAGKLLDSVSQSKHLCFFIHGFGLGYHVVELNNRHDRPMVIVAEPDAGVIKAALCVRDFSELILAGRLIFLVRADKTEFHTKLSQCNADLMLGVQTIALPHTRRCRVEFHQRAGRELPEFLAYTRMQMVTLLKVARVTAKNVLFNLPHYIANPGVEVLRERAAGYPAIIAAAGPSLARHLPLLGELRERAVLIAVQTVYKLLRALECDPHFVTSLDYHEVSADFFDGVAATESCALVAEPKATWRVLDLYDGPLHVLHHPLYEFLLGDACPQRGSLRGGTTVAHLAFYLAEHLGCDPIIFVGQDLAFSEGMFYMPGSPIERTWRPELGRFSTIEMKQWERIVRRRPILRSLTDMHGSSVYTDDMLYSYAEQFQRDFIGSRARVIQASESGLALSGMEVMPLATAARQYCTRPLPMDLFATKSAERLTKLDALRSALHERMRELREVTEIASEMTGLLEKLEGLVSRPAEFNRVVVRVDSLRTRMQQFGRTYRQIVEISTVADLRRYSADRRIGAPEKETPETARKRLARDREFVDAFLDGCRFLLPLLNDAEQRLEERWK